MPTDDCPTTGDCPTTADSAPGNPFASPGGGLPHAGSAPGPPLAPPPVPAPGGRASGPARGGVRPEERALAPDFARGVMLLLIALSNTAFHLWNAERGPDGWHPVDGSALDSGVQFAMIIGLDMRINPLFAFLFGYGMMWIHQRQLAAGADSGAAVRLLRRRGLWLMVFGAAHALLLMAGDIVAYYGLLGLLMCWLFVRRPDRVLIRWCWIGLGLMVVWLAVAALPHLVDGFDAGGGPAEPSHEAYGAHQSGWAAAAGTRAITHLIVGYVGPFAALLSGTFVVFVLGMLAARHRVLEEPWRHLRLLRGTAVAGLALGWLGPLPLALAHTGALDLSDAMVSDIGPLVALRDATGQAGGLGYVAVLTLLSHALVTRGAHRSRPVVAVSAVGKRSLSCYFAHSLLFAPLLAAWGLGLGEHLGSATMLLVGVGVWLVTVTGAYALELRGRRGPLEVLLRRLMYGRAASSAVRPTAPDGRTDGSAPYEPPVPRQGSEAERP